MSLGPGVRRRGTRSKLVVDEPIRMGGVGDTTSCSTPSRGSNGQKQQLERSPADMYIDNCNRFDMAIDPSIVIALRTKWDIIMPSKTFGEGGLLPLLGVLETNDHVRKMNLASASMWESRWRGMGNGNSNARVLGDILCSNDAIDEVILSDTGLDDDGMTEICRALRANRTVTSLDLSRNHFTQKGVVKLTRALESNSSLKFLDLSRNALGFQAVYELQCACSATGLLIKTGGNHVFEEIMNAVSHAVGFIASVVGSTLLMTEAIAKGTDYHYWSAALFSFSLMFLFFSSTLYHSFFMLPSAAWILQIFDHVGIYFLIAGSYTPFMLIGLHHSSEARFLLAVEWLLAALGAIYAASVDLSKPMTNVIECTVFLTMGFGCILVLPQMNASMPVECVNLLFVGGAAYALGIIFYVMGEYKPIFHVFWHCVVVLAAALHWFAVYFYVMPMDLNRDISMYSSS